MTKPSGGTNCFSYFFSMVWRFQKGAYLFCKSITEETLAKNVSQEGFFKVFFRQSWRNIWDICRSRRIPHYTSRRKSQFLKFRLNINLRTLTYLFLIIFVCRIIQNLEENIHPTQFHNWRQLFMFVYTYIHVHTADFRVVLGKICM